MFNRELRNIGAGFCIGICITLLFRSQLLGTGFLDETVLAALRSMSVDYAQLFVHLLRKRLFLLVSIAALSTTYLGKPVCLLEEGWFGMAVGVFLSTLTIRYGLKGQVLAIVWLFPHFLLFTPAFLLLMAVGSSRQGAIPYRRSAEAAVAAYNSTGTKDGTDVQAETKSQTSGEWWKTGKYPGQARKKEYICFAVICILTIAGCILEAYLNPVLLKGYLRNF